MKMLRRLAKLFRRSYPLSEVRLPGMFSSLVEATKLYGPPVGSDQNGELWGATDFSFQPNEFVRLDVTTWRGQIHRLVAWSERPDPAADLAHMLDRFHEGQGWRCVQPGFLYVRNDDRLRLWCSAFPVIGVGSLELHHAILESAESAVKEEVQAKFRAPGGWPQGNLCWTPDKEVGELQRLAGLGELEPLRSFAAGSPLIAHSADGEFVLIVRDHRASATGLGFVEQNLPPGKGDDSTQVINIFGRMEGGSHWGKVALPRDASVQAMAFEGDQVRLRLLRRHDRAVFQYLGVVRDLHDLGSAMEKGEGQMWCNIEANCQRVG